MAGRLRHLVDVDCARFLELDDCVDERLLIGAKVAVKTVDILTTEGARVGGIVEKAHDDRRRVSRVGGRDRQQARTQQLVLDTAFDAIRSSNGIDRDRQRLSKHPPADAILVQHVHQFAVDQIVEKLAQRLSIGVEVALRVEPAATPEGCEQDRAGDNRSAMIGNAHWKLLLCPSTAAGANPLSASAGGGRERSGAHWFVPSLVRTKSRVIVRPATTVTVSLSFVVKACDAVTLTGPGVRFLRT